MNQIPLMPEDNNEIYTHDTLTFILENDIGLTPGKARSFAAHFADLEEFATATKESIEHIVSVTGRKILKLTDENIQSIIAFQATGFLDPKSSLKANFTAAIGRQFTRRQVSMIASLHLADLNPNPFLIEALALHTPQELMKLNVYMATTRSIVTSMGFTVGRLILDSSEKVKKIPKGWDFLKTDADGSKHWLQVKSGTNDMDKDQIIKWVDEISEVVGRGEQGYIAMTYGKKDNDTVTLGLIKQHLPDWEMRTLVGRELWDFLSEESNYHVQLFESLRTAANQILQNRTISGLIDDCILRVTEEFIATYGDGVEGVNAYLALIM